MWLLDLFSACPSTTHRSNEASIRKEPLHYTCTTAGTPPVKRGRPLSEHCQPNKDEAGKSINFGDQEPENLFGPKGWCNAEQPSTHCPCIMVGPLPLFAAQEP